MSGWYEVSKSSSGQYRFVLKAANAETILTSKLYTTRVAADKGIAAVQSNSPLEERQRQGQWPEHGDQGQDSAGALITLPQTRYISPGGSEPARDEAITSNIDVDCQAPSRAGSLPRGRCGLSGSAQFFQ